MEIKSQLTFLFNICFSQDPPHFPHIIFQATSLSIWESTQKIWYGFSYKDFIFTSTSLPLQQAIAESGPCFPLPPVKSYRQTFPLRQVT